MKPIVVVKILQEALRHPMNVKNQILILKGKQKSPGRATSRSRSQPPTPRGREKVTQLSNSKEPQQKYRLGTVSIKILGGGAGGGVNPVLQDPNRPQLLLWLKPYS